MTPRQFASLAKQALRGWSDDNAGSMGAALAFYALFSMAPLLLLVISLVALVVDAEVPRRLIFEQLTGLLGAKGAEAVHAVLLAADQREEGILAASASLAMLVLGATSVLGELQRDLDRIWRYEKPASVGWLK